MKLVRRGITASVLGMTWISRALACPGCKDPAAVSSGKVSGINAGFDMSIIFMLCVVFLVVGGLTAFIVRTCRQIDKERSLR